MPPTPDRRRGARRARPRAARGRHRAARAGVRAGRRRHRQDPGDHPPDRLRRARRASTSRSRCWPSPSPPGPPARCAAGCASSAPAGCRPAPSTPRRCASCATSGRGTSAASCPSWSTHKAGWSPRRPAGCGCATDRATVRDLAAEIEWAKVTMTDRDDYPAAAAKAGRGAPAGSTRRGGPAALDVRGGQAGPRRHRLRGRAAAHRRRCSPSTGQVADAVRGAVPALRRRRVPGRQPAAAAAARPVARRPRRALRGRRRQPDDLLLHRRLARLPARLPAPAPDGHAWCGWSATTAPPRRSSALANRLARRQPGRPRRTALELVAQRPPGPSRTCASYPTSRPRPRPSPAGSGR